MAKQSHNMSYASDKEEILMPEYGRGVQELVQHARTLTDPVAQQQAIEYIIQIILTLQPQTRSIEDYREKLWKHIFRIADYELTAVPTVGEVPEREADMLKPTPTPYPAHNAKYRHYGSSVRLLIERAKEMEEGPIRQGLIYTIGSYMKLAYKTWNKENYPGDETVREDLLNMSDGQLDMSAVGQEVGQQANADRVRRQVHPEQPDLMSPSQRRRYYQQQFNAGTSGTSSNNRTAQRNKRRR
jgi:hypothetical protein